MRKLKAAILTSLLGSACGSGTTHVASADSNHHRQQGQPQHSEHQHGQHQHGQHGFADADRFAQIFDDPSRDAWQRPGDVLHALELEPSMTVVDLGAGTGYFAVRLARALPQGQVIATDIEPDMLRFMNERADREGLSNLYTLQASPTESGLTANSVDRILIVHVWHHMENRVEYARGLASALKPGGRLLVVDFAMDAQRGPPQRMRLAPEVIARELEAAGLRARVLPVALPDQYIVEGQFEG